MTESYNISFLQQENERLRKENQQLTLKVSDLRYALYNILNPFHKLEDKKLPIDVICKIANDASYLRHLASEALIKEYSTDEN